MLSDCELAKNEQDKHVGLPSSQVVRVWWDFLQQNGSGITLHVIVNWRFWIPDIPIMKGIGILKGSAGQCQNHPAPEQQFTIR